MFPHFSSEPPRNSQYLKLISSNFNPKPRGSLFHQASIMGNSFSVTTPTDYTLATNISGFSPAPILSRVFLNYPVQTRESRFPARLEITTLFSNNDFSNTETSKYTTDCYTQESDGSLKGRSGGGEHVTDKCIQLNRAVTSKQDNPVSIKGNIARETRINSNDAPVLKDTASISPEQPNLPLPIRTSQVVFIPHRLIQLFGRPHAHDIQELMQ